jgi:uncharacterized membrane protein
MSLFTHEKHPHMTRNLNDVHSKNIAIGAKVSDIVAAYVGSWRFVLLMTGLLIAWIVWNTIPLLPHFDPAPFILCNLCLSFIAGYTGPFVMMSQNRQSAKDRVTAEEDYNINRKGEHEIAQMIQHLDAQDEAILQILEKIDKIIEQRSN